VWWPGREPSRQEGVGGPLGLGFRAGRLVWPLGGVLVFVLFFFLFFFCFSVVGWVESWGGVVCSLLPFLFFLFCLEASGGFYPLVVLFVLGVLLGLGGCFVFRVVFSM